jgi:hypothetical protein
MADFPKRPNGDIDDRVRLKFRGLETVIYEQYSVRMAVLQQPAKFAVTLGASVEPRVLFGAYPPNTPFELLIGPSVKAFSGRTDAYGSDGPPSTMSISGRDILARLHDARFDADRSYVNISYADLVYEVLKEVGGLEDRAILASNEANIIIRSGVGVITKPGTPGTPPKIGGGPAPAGTPGPQQRRPDGYLSEREGRRTAEVERTTDATPTRERKDPKKVERVQGLQGTPGVPTRYVVHAKAGERCLEVIQRHLTKAGVMLWSDANGDFVVATPNPYQAPRYAFVRRRGQERSVVNIKSHSFKNDTTNRVAKLKVFGRKAGGGKGKGLVSGEAIDPEMIELGYTHAEVERDANVFDDAQAVKYALAKLAELNRAAWSLQYTIRGHTTPTPDGGRAVITPDTTAEVYDDELGIYGTYYIESVEYRSPPTETVVTLMRPEDLFFEVDPTVVEQFEKAKKGRKRRK